MPLSPSQNECIQNIHDIEVPQPPDEDKVMQIVNYELLYKETKNEILALREKLEVKTEKLKRTSTIVKRLNNQNQKNKNNKKIFADKLQKLKIIIKKYKNLAQQKDHAAKRAVEEALGKHFSDNEIKLFTGQQKKVHWTTEEISKAFTLRYLSKRAYIYVRRTLKYPLPGKHIK